jgi:hypothetical protein
LSRSALHILRPSISRHYRRLFCPTAAVLPPVDSVKPLSWNTAADAGGESPQLEERCRRDREVRSPVRQEDRRLLLRWHVARSSRNQSDLSFGTAVITPRWL